MGEVSNGCIYLRDPLVHQATIQVAASVQVCCSETLGEFEGPKNPADLEVNRRSPFHLTQHTFATIPWDSAYKPVLLNLSQKNKHIQSTPTVETNGS